MLRRVVPNAKRSEVVAARRGDQNQDSGSAQDGKANARCWNSREKLDVPATGDLGAGEKSRDKIVAIEGSRRARSNVCMSHALRACRSSRRVALAPERARFRAVCREQSGRRDDARLRRIPQQLDAVIAQTGRSSCAKNRAPVCGTALKSVLRQPTSACSGCSMPTRSRRCTRCRSQGRPQSRNRLPVRQEGREDAVLHVKHRHVLVQRQLEPRRRRGARADRAPARCSGRS